MSGGPYDLLNVKSWPTKWRRVFVVLLPFSLVLWFIYGFVLVALCAIIFVVAAPIVAAVELWRKTP